MKKISILALLTIISIIIPISINMFYNSNYYFSNKYVNNNINDIPIITNNISNIDADHIEIKKDSAVTNNTNNTNIYKKKIWICNNSRKLIQGDGNVRECGWK